MGSTGRGGGWCARGPRGGASWAGEWLEQSIDVDGLGNALGDGLHAASKRGMGGWAALDGARRPWRMAHLKRNGNGTTLVASRLERGGTAWLQALAQQNLRGGEQEQGELRWPARRDDGGTRVAARQRSTRRDGTAHGEGVAKVQ
jgi:hypothetical protein